MVSIEEFKRKIFALSADEKLHLFDELALHLYKELEARDLAIVEERLARLDAGIDKTIPWEEVHRKVFGNT